MRGALCGFWGLNLCCCGFTGILQKQKQPAQSLQTQVVVFLLYYMFFAYLIFIFRTFFRLFFFFSTFIQNLILFPIEYFIRKYFFHSSLSLSPHHKNLNILICMKKTIYINMYAMERHGGMLSLYASCWQIRVYFSTSYLQRK